MGPLHVGEAGAAPYLITAVVLSSLGTGIYQSTALSLVSNFPPRFFAVCLFGVGISGIVSNVMGIVTQAALPHSYEGHSDQSKVFYSVSGGIIVLTLASLSLFRCNPYAQRYVPEYRPATWVDVDAGAGGNGGDKNEGGDAPPADPNVGGAGEGSSSAAEASQRDVSPPSSATADATAAATHATTQEAICDACRLPMHHMYGAPTPPKRALEGALAADHLDATAPPSSLPLTAVVPLDERVESAFPSPSPFLPPTRPASAPNPLVLPPFTHSALSRPLRSDSTATCECQVVPLRLPNADDEQVTKEGNSDDEMGDSLSPAKEGGASGAADDDNSFVIAVPIALEAVQSASGGGGAAEGQSSQAPTVASASVASAAGSSSVGVDGSDSDANVKARADNAAEPAPHVSVVEVFRQTWDMQLATFVTFVITLFIMPAVAIAVDPTAQWYPIIVITICNVSDTAGRYIPALSQRLWAPRRAVLPAAVARVAFVGLWFLAYKSRLVPGQAYPMVLMAATGLSSGYVGSMAMLYAPMTTGLTSEAMRGVCGSMVSFSLLLGCSVGATVGWLVTTYTD